MGADVSQDVIASGYMCAVCTAVIASVGLTLGDQGVLVFGGDRLMAAPAGGAEGHGGSFVTRRNYTRAGTRVLWCCD
jgi:hypothetical protein